MFELEQDIPCFALIEDQRTAHRESLAPNLDCWREIQDETDAVPSREGRSAIDYGCGKLALHQDGHARRAPLGKYGVERVIGRLGVCDGIRAAVDDDGVLARGVHRDECGARLCALVHDELCGVDAERGERRPR